MGRSFDQVAVDTQLQVSFTHIGAQCLTALYFLLITDGKILVREHLCEHGPDLFGGFFHLDEIIFQIIIYGFSFEGDLSTFQLHLLGSDIFKSSDTHLCYLQMFLSPSVGRSLYP